MAGVAVSAPSGIAQSGLALSVDAVSGLAEISGGRMAGCATLGTELSVSGPFAATVAEGSPPHPRRQPKRNNKGACEPHASHRAATCHSPGAASRTRLRPIPSLWMPIDFGISAASSSTNRNGIPTPRSY